MVGILYLNLLRKYVLSFNTKLALGVTIICFSAAPTNYFYLLVPKSNKKMFSTPMKFNFRSQRLLKNPGEPTAGSHLPPTTNGKVESLKEGTALILLVLLCNSFPFLPLHANPVTSTVSLSRDYWPFPYFCAKAVFTIRKLPSP